MDGPLMQSGTFHVMSQDWRYFAREKSLIHTLHLGQTPPSTNGDTILIGSVSPTSGSVGHLPDLPPINPYGGTNNINIIPSGTFPCWAYHYETYQSNGQFASQPFVPFLLEKFKNASISRSITVSLFTLNVNVGQGGVFQIELRTFWSIATVNAFNYPLEPLSATLQRNGTQVAFIPAYAVGDIQVTILPGCIIAGAALGQQISQWVGAIRASQGGTVSLVVSVPQQGGVAYVNTVQFSMVKVSE